MNKMNAYQTTAKAVHATLTTAHDDAMDDAQARLQHATETAGADTIRPQLIALCDTFAPPASDTVTSVLNGYTAMFAPHLQRDGEMMIRSLCSMKKQHRLSDTQSAAIASSLLACVHGKAHGGLIQFPAAGAWHFNLSVADLHQWAGWVAPEAHTELQGELGRIMRERFKAERDLARLNAHKQALDMLAAAQANATGNVIRIKSNTSNRVNVAGVFFEPGELKDLGFNEYAELADHAGFRRMINVRQLEVVA